MVTPESLHAWWKGVLGETIYAYGLNLTKIEVWIYTAHRCLEMPDLGNYWGRKKKEGEEEREGQRFWVSDVPGVPRSELEIILGGYRLDTGDMWFPQIKT